MSTSKADGDTKALMGRMQQQQNNQNAMTALQAELSEQQGKNAVVSNMADAFQKNSKALSDKQSQGAG